MEKKSNKLIAVAYKLYTTAPDGTTKMAEEAPADNPFKFISGFGIALEGFEQAVEPLEEGAEFDFTLDQDQAYGAYEPERVVQLDKEIFTIDGRFDSERLYVDAIVPLQNEAGQRFMARVLEIGDDKVKLDLNHPFAGAALHFTGKVLESREATNDEIQMMINMLSGEGGCGGCGGGGCHKDGGCHGGGCGGCH